MTRTDAASQPQRALTCILDAFEKIRLAKLLRMLLLACLLVFGCGTASGCSSGGEPEGGTPMTPDDRSASVQTLSFTAETPTTASEEAQLEDGLSCVLFEGDSLVDEFLTSGGADSDQEVIAFLARATAGAVEPAQPLDERLFGCSFIQAPSQSGGYISGRNFDWYPSEACVVESKPTEGYGSISTVNKGFLRTVGADLMDIPEALRPLIYEYAPLDGMNEQGLVVAVLMIEDAASIDQHTGKPGLTTTTAVRILLDKAATVDEAIDILGSCDMHSSLGYMVHFALSDSTGRSVAIEYIDNEMVVTESPIITNFYLAEGQKHGVGSTQSHERYMTLERALDSKKAFDETSMAEALENVSKHHFNDGETTEWSQVMDQRSGTVTYFHREDFSKAYVFQLEGRQ